jgi:hypothetical protein
MNPCGEQLVYCIATTLHKMTGTDYPMTQHYIPEKLSPQDSAPWSLVNYLVQH